MKNRQTQRCGCKLAGNKICTFIIKCRLCSAAPELLAACEKYLASMEEALLREDPDAALHMEWDAEPMASLRALIAKSGGTRS